MSKIYEKKIYTNDELEILRNEYGTMPVREIRKKLFKKSGISRTEKEITAKASCLKLTNKRERNNWHYNEIEELKKLYPLLTRKNLAEYFKRTPNSIKQAIRYHCKELVEKSHIDKNYKLHCIINKWTDEEILFLIENKDKPYSFLLEKLDRTIQAIKRKKTQLKIRNSKRYKKHEDKFILNNLNKMPQFLIAIELERSEKSLKRRIKILKDKHEIKN